MVRNKEIGLRSTIGFLHWSAFSGTIFAVGLFFLSTIVSDAGNAWFPQEVHVDDGKTGSESIRYEPLSTARENWKICVALPQLSDSFWEAIAYGLTDEARRLGVRLQINQSGRYGGEQVQSKQISDCIADGGKAVILSAVVEESLSDLAATLADRGIPLVTLVGDIRAEQVAARLTGSLGRNGEVLGRHLTVRHKESRRPVRVAWFPGPESASWSRAADRGFREAIANAKIELVAVRWGDVNRETQTRLLNEVLRAHSDLDYVVGNAVAAEIATVLLRKRKRTKKTRVASYYLGLGVYRGILRGRISVAATHAPVIEARMAVDQAVRLLEGGPSPGNLRTPTRIIDQESIGTFDLSKQLAPLGFSVTGNVR